MKSALLTVILAAITCFPNARGQTAVRTLTLTETIVIAKTQSADAMNAIQTFKASYWDWRSYQASNLPSLGLTATLPYINQSISSQSVNGVQSYASYKYISANANLGLTQRIGGRISRRFHL